MSVLDLAAALKLKALKIISDEQEALDKANIALENHVFLIKKMRVEKVGKQKEADKKKELNKNMPTGGLMKRMAKMRGKILAQADITEKSGLALDDEEISKTLENAEIEEEDEAEPEAEADNLDKTETVTNIEQYDNSQSFMNTSRTKTDKIDYDLIQKMIDPDLEIKITTEEQLEEFIV